MTDSVVVTSGNNMLLGTSGDIGAEGISVIVAQLVPKESEVSVEFGLPGVEGRFLTKATVKRSEKRPDGFLLGLQFKTEGWVMAAVQEYVRYQAMRIRQQKTPEEKDRPKAPAPKPFKQEKPREQGDGYKPTKLTIDLDSSERASEVARLFKEAMKKKD